MTIIKHDMTYHRASDNRIYVNVDDLQMFLLKIQAEISDESTKIS